MDPTESDLRRLFLRAPIGIYRSTVDGRILFANDALAAMLGYDHPSELLALRLQTDVYYQPRERGPMVELYLSAGRVDGVDVRWKTKHGTPIDVRIFGTAVSDENGEGFDGYAIDITAQRRAEAELRASRVEANRKDTVLDLLLSELPALIWMVDAQLVVTSVSGRGTWELPLPDQLVGRQIDRLELFGDHAAAHHRAALQGAVVPFEIERGAAIYAATVAPHRDDSGAIVGAIGTAVDVTSTRHMERKMEQAQRAESMGLLAGGMAHDFNNLLVAILGNADLALRELPGQVQGRGAVHNIRVAALRAADLTGQLLAFAGGGSPVRAAIAVTPLVEELVVLLRGTLPPSITIAVNADARIEPVLADASQLRQVLLNLITNARDALQEHAPGRAGAIAIEIAALAVTEAAQPDDVISPKSGQYVAIEVRDDGPGMPPEIRERIFEPFFTTKAKGSGLGLAAMMGIIRDHDGGIRVDSEPGRGTRFTVLMPVATQARAARDTAGQTPSPPPTIMIVDDEVMVADVLGAMLEELGYRPIVMNDGGAAAALAADPARIIDAVIIDLTMPSLSGREVIERLRHHRPTVPIFVCSGYDRSHGMPLDVQGFLRKPFRIDQLAALLSQLIPA